jgi:hypothetical protein
VIATIRTGEICPDAIVSLWKDAGAERVELSPLGEDEIWEIVETIVGGPVEERIHRRLKRTTTADNRLPAFARRQRGIPGREEHQMRHVRAAHVHRTRILHDQPAADWPPHSDQVKSVTAEMTTSSGGRL